MSRYEFHKIIMGYILIGVWACLDMCIVGLTAISTQWAQYMFGRKHPDDEPTPPPATLKPEE